MNHDDSCHSAVKSKESTFSPIIDPFEGELSDTKTLIQSPNKSKKRSRAIFSDPDLSPNSSLEASGYKIQRVSDKNMDRSSKVERNIANLDAVVGNPSNFTRSPSGNRIGDVVVTTGSPLGSNASIGQCLMGMPVSLKEVPAAGTASTTRAYSQVQKQLQALPQPPESPVNEIALLKNLNQAQYLDTRNLDKVAGNGNGTQIKVVSKTNSLNSLTNNNSSVRAESAEQQVPRKKKNPSGNGTVTSSGYGQRKPNGNAQPGSNGNSGPSILRVRDWSPDNSPTNSKNPFASVEEVDSLNAGRDPRSPKSTKVATGLNRRSPQSLRQKARAQQQLRKQRNPSPTKDLSMSASESVNVSPAQSARIPIRDSAAQSGASVDDLMCPAPTNPKSGHDDELMLTDVEGGYTFPDSVNNVTNGNGNRITVLPNTDYTPVTAGTVTTNQVTSKPISIREAFPLSRENVGSLKVGPAPGSLGSEMDNRSSRLSGENNSGIQQQQAREDDVLSNVTDPQTVVSMPRENDGTDCERINSQMDLRPGSGIDSKDSMPGSVNASIVSRGPGSNQNQIPISGSQNTLDIRTNARTATSDGKNRNSSRSPSPSRGTGSGNTENVLGHNEPHRVTRDMQTASSTLHKDSEFSDLADAQTNDNQVYQWLDAQAQLVKNQNGGENERFNTVGNDVSIGTHGNSNGVSANGGSTLPIKKNRPETRTAADGSSGQQTQTARGQRGTSNMNESGSRPGITARNGGTGSTNLGRANNSENGDDSDSNNQRNNQSKSVSHSIVVSPSQRFGVDHYNIPFLEKYEYKRYMSYRKQGISLKFTHRTDVYGKEVERIASSHMYEEGMFSLKMASDAKTKGEDIFSTFKSDHLPYICELLDQVETDKFYGLTHLCGYKTVPLRRDFLPPNLPDVMLWSWEIKRSYLQELDQELACASLFSGLAQRNKQIDSEFLCYQLVPVLSDESVKFNTELEYFYELHRLDSLSKKPQGVNTKVMSILYTESNVPLDAPKRDSEKPGDKVKKWNFYLHACRKFPYEMTLEDEARGGSELQSSMFLALEMKNCGSNAAFDWYKGFEAQINHCFIDISLLVSLAACMREVILKNTVTWKYKDYLPFRSSSMNVERNSMLRNMHEVTIPNLISPLEAAHDHAVLQRLDQNFRNNVSSLDSFWNGSRNFRLQDIAPSALDSIDENQNVTDGQQVQNFIREEIFRKELFNMQNPNAKPGYLPVTREHFMSNALLAAVDVLENYAVGITPTHKMWEKMSSMIERAEDISDFIKNIKKHVKSVVGSSITSLNDSITTPKSVDSARTLLGSSRTLNNDTVAESGAVELARAAMNRGSERRQRFRRMRSAMLDGPVSGESSNDPRTLRVSGLESLTSSAVPPEFSAEGGSVDLSLGTASRERNMDLTTAGVSARTYSRSLDQREDQEPGSPDLRRRLRNLTEQTQSVSNAITRVLPITNFLVHSTLKFIQFWFVNSISFNLA